MNHSNNNDSINLNNNQNNNLINSDEEEDENFGICPITKQYMKNPVLAPSGNYYEKDAILKWINENKNDPLTKEPLSADILIEDNDYKKAIIEYKRKHNK